MFKTLGNILRGLFWSLISIAGLYALGLVIGIAGPPLSSLLRLTPPGSFGYGVGNGLARLSLTIREWPVYEGIFGFKPTVEGFVQTVDQGADLASKVSIDVLIIAVLGTLVVSVLITLFTGNSPSTLVKVIGLGRNAFSAKSTAFYSLAVIDFAVLGYRLWDAGFDAFMQAVPSLLIPAGAVVLVIVILEVLNTIIGKLIALGAAGLGYVLYTAFIGTPVVTENLTLTVPTATWAAKASFWWNSVPALTQQIFTFLAVGAILLIAANLTKGKASSGKK